MTKRTIPIRIPIDVVKDLQSTLPKMNWAQRMRTMHKDHVEIRNVKSKLTQIGVKLYGKKTWKDLGF